MKTAEEVLALYQSRKDRLAQTHAKFREIRAAVLNEIDIDLPELDRRDRPAVANLILTGVTQTGNRIASTMPNPYFPATRLGSDAALQRASVRRQRTLDWYDKNNIKAIMRRRSLHYLCYAAAPVVVRPNPRYREDREDEMSPVLWEIRDPLTTFPATTAIGQVVPDDCIFAYRMSYSWVENRYGKGVLNDLMVNGDRDQTITLLDYIDSDEVSVYAISDRSDESEKGPQYGIVGSTFGPQQKPKGKPIVPVRTMANKAGRPICSIPGQISLERPQSMYEGLVDLARMQGKLMALEMIGMERSIWPEEWLVGRQGETPNIVTQADPIGGIMGEVSGGDIKINAPSPAQFGVNLIDRVERGQRIEAGIPAEYGGESGTNIRTDKRGNAVLSQTVDFSIQAAHEQFELALREENRIGAAIEKGYFPKKKTFSSSTGTHVYVPEELWEKGHVHWMRYSAAGSDADQLVVAGGQRLGIGTLSHRSFMEIDPLVDDPEMEIERVRSEQLEAMLFANLSAQAQQDPAYMTVIAKLNEQLRQDNAPDPLAAWLTLHTEYQQQQAQQQQQPPTGPEAQPGLEQPGAIPQPGPDLSNLGQLVQDLRHTSRNPMPPVPAGG